MIALLREQAAITSDEEGKLRIEELVRELHGTVITMLPLSTQQRLQRIIV